MQRDRGVGLLEHTDGGILTMLNRAFGLAVAGLALMTSSLVAQAIVPPRLAGSLNAIIAQPVGEFNDYVNVGFGVGGNFRVALDPSGITSLRFDAGYVNYGRETQEVCLSETVGCRIVVDLTTTNNIVFGYGGLQIAAPEGPVRPYVNGGLGYSYFFTESSVEGTSNEEPFASTTNFDDGTFSWAAGGGLMIPISSGRTPVSIDLGVRYNHNGEVDYLTRGAIVDNPDGSIDLFPTRSSAHLVTYLIGVSIAFGPGR